MAEATNQGDWIVELSSPDGTSRTYVYVSNQSASDVGAAEARAKEIAQGSYPDWNINQWQRVRDGAGIMVSGSLDTLRDNSKTLATGFAAQYPVQQISPGTPESDAQFLTRISGAMPGGFTGTPVTDLGMGAPATGGVPVIGEGQLPSGAWTNALRNIGFDTGVQRSIAGGLRGGLQNMAQIGQAANLRGNVNFPSFQDAREGYELQDFFEATLPNAINRMNPTGWNMADKARRLFDIQSPNAALTAFQQPDLSMQPGSLNWADNPLGQISGTRAAEMMAQLGLTGYGRGQFGALSAYLPSARQLVSQWGGQAADDPASEADLRQYIRTRLGAGQLGRSY